MTININSDELKKIKEIDWDFSNEKTNFFPHNFHSYPAKFIPQIPFYLIKLFSNIGDTVYDPFCGSGTTLVEAIRLERNAIGNDANPLAVLISKVKTTAITPVKLLQLKKIIEIIKKFDIVISPSNKLKNIATLQKFKIQNIDYWFESFVIEELLFIKNKVEELEDIKLRNFCFLALSYIIISVSNQDSDTRYTKVRKNIKALDTINKFCNRLNYMIKDMETNYKILEKCNSEIIIEDTRRENIFKENIADIVITSPPYPNAYDYHLYHKHRMNLLEMDPLELKKIEIGAHAHYSKNNGLTEFDFKEDMFKCFKNISKILKKDKYFFIVIGNSIIKGRNIQNNELLKSLSDKTNFKFMYEIDRKINLTKKSFNPVIGKIKNEKIMVFINNK